RSCRLSPRRHRAGERWRERSPAQKRRCSLRPARYAAHARMCAAWPHPRATTVQAWEHSEGLRPRLIVASICLGRRALSHQGPLSQPRRLASCARPLGASRPVISELVAPGPITLGPITLGPNTLGPITLGPNTLGPITLGPITLGPITQGSTGARPCNRRRRTPHRHRIALRHGAKFR